MNITIEAIKEQHNKVAEMIAAFEANAKLSAAFPITVNFPRPNAGEQYVGSIISADGKKREHIILLPGELTGDNWDDSMTWAASIGGELPDRVESALLFATLKDQFHAEGYWTREQDAHDDGYAWMQSFISGNQNDIRKSVKYRARAVRREFII
ncbi:DUF1566 domain-containing protein [Undibacterium rivi]|uniref:DUF1566 domain-containing protein n=1 Tax=Undibacterium rivi TaxID=2828729 RepID=UPI001E371D65|nr:DUF1566 domain-containing protein [Undibacterium rivi]